MRAPLLERQLDDGSSPGRRGLEPQGGLARVPQREPAAYGDEPECSRARRFVRDARPVVLDGTDELRTLGQLRPHGDLAAARAHQRAVLHRVLDQRLEQQLRQERLARAAANLPVESEMACVARLEDLRVSAQPVDLLVQRLYVAAWGYRIAQQVAQGAEQPARLARILGYQPRDRIER